MLLENHTDVCLLMDGHAELLPWGIALIGTDIALCIAERTDPWMIETHYWNKKSRHLWLSLGDRIVLLQQEYAHSLPEDFNTQIRIIPNAILNEHTANLLRIPYFNSKNAPFTIKSYQRRPTAVCIASRLDDKVKQISLCIKAFALLPKSCNHWTLEIYGDGEDKAKLVSMANDFNVQDRVHFHGFVHDITKHLNQGQIFAIPSAFEGFPNALLDAMQSGLPAIGFEQCRALRGIMGDKNIGLLAPDMTAECYAKTLALLMIDTNLRFQLARNAHRLSKEYDLTKILPMWDKTLLECATEPLKRHTTFSKDKIQQLHLAMKDIIISKRQHIANTIPHLRERCKSSHPPQNTALQQG